MDFNLEDMLKRLEEARDAIKKINDDCGFTKRTEDIKKLIETHGWDCVCEIYHPDNNVNDPASHEMFALCKYIYENMCKKT